MYHSPSTDAYRSSGDTHKSSIGEIATLNSPTGLLLIGLLMIAYLRIRASCFSNSGNSICILQSSCIAACDSGYTPYRLYVLASTSHMEPETSRSTVSSGSSDVPASLSL